MKSLENANYAVAPYLDPNKALPAPMGKSDVARWELALKDEVGRWMADPRSPFDALKEQLRSQSFPKHAEICSEATEKKLPADEIQPKSKTGPLVSSRSVFSLVEDLRAHGSLPAILFNYDRKKCESIGREVIKTLIEAEKEYRATNPAWIAKLADFEEWKKTQRDAKARHAHRGVVILEKGMGKAELERQAASIEASKWESFNQYAPLPEFSFADASRASNEEVEERIKSMDSGSVRPWLVGALYRGIGVHHSGMNRQYRQV